jgi:hypothetical protein
MVEADPDERAAHVERVGHQLEHRSALLEHREEAPARLQLVGAGAVEERSGSADVERLCRRGGQLEERRSQRVEKGELRAERLGSSIRLRSKWVPGHPGEPLVQYSFAQEARPDRPASKVCFFATPRSR